MPALLWFASGVSKAKDCRLFKRLLELVLEAEYGNAIFHDAMQMESYGTGRCPRTFRWRINICSLLDYYMIYWFYDGFMATSIANIINFILHFYNALNT